MLRVAHRGDRGFTLVELMVAMAILGTIITAVGGALIVAFKTQGPTQARLEQSHDAQMMSSYFGPDVQSASSVTVAPTDDKCDDAGAILRLTGERPDPGGSTTVVTSYVARTVGGERQVRRHRCEGSSPMEDIAVVHRLGSAVPAVTCSPACSPATASTPGRVDVSMTVTAATDPGDYSFWVRGRRRSS